MKVYTKGMLALIALAAIYGFLVPTLLSMRDSIAVVSGLLIAVFAAKQSDFILAKNTSTQ